MGIDITNIVISISIIIDITIKFSSFFLLLSSIRIVKKIGIFL